jgi:lycopene cyclase domain-containing protein
VDRFQYLLLMAGCALGTLPLEWVLGARVYRRPRRLARALLPVVAAFYAWDAVAIARGHWWFDRGYTTGWLLPLGVPVEELVFFLVIPVCALLSMEAVGNVMARGWRGAVAGNRRTPAPTRSGAVP